MREFEDLKVLTQKNSKIESIISCIKRDHCLDRNFLPATDGDRTNSILAGEAFNLKKIMRALTGLCKVFVLKVIFQRKYQICRA